MTAHPTRRVVLQSAGAAGAVAAGAGGLAACGSGSSADGATTTVKTADVPIGGGKIVGSVVVTQPAAGTYKAFSAICTHQGCTVSSVAKNEIDCACHGSAFDASTGAVVTGPATKPLAAKNVTVSGDTLTVT